MPRNYRTEPSVPFEPLRRFLDLEDQVTIARMIGTCRRTVVRTSQRDSASLVADELAVHLGVHPSAIWTDWFSIPARAVSVPLNPKVEK